MFLLGEQSTLRSSRHYYCCDATNLENSHNYTLNAD